MKVDHTPNGNPCTTCGKHARLHRVEHAFQGSSPRCAKCDLPAENHRDRAGRERSEAWKERQRHRQRKQVRPRFFLGVDGEGRGKEDHKYVLLAASDAEGEREFSIEEPEGLSTVQCLDFLLGLPRRAKLFGFSFNYDLTKILKDVSDEMLFFLFRPELRKHRPGHKSPMPRPVHWNGYKLNLLGRKFTCQKGKRSIVLWDVFAFYQSSFVKALADWTIGEEKELAKIEEMKKKRAEFDKLPLAQVRSYCFSECKYLAQLVERLVEAHTQAGLELRNFFGAGSTATALLKEMGIPSRTAKDDADEKRASRIAKAYAGPVWMHKALRQAFFGGRFEHSTVGMVEGPVYAYDIASAYPYHITNLPCLLHGKWTLTKSRTRVLKATAALVRYRMHDIGQTAWAPFPFRMKDGTIIFPRQSPGGWLWRDEFEMGRTLYPKQVEFREAWVFEAKCTHKPFKRISECYIQRLRIGKEGAGIIFKLGPNSVYGKLAQSIGDPPFQSWIWAGMITSNTRAQILDMLGRHDDPYNLLAVATDGMYTRERIAAPLPRDTGTNDAVDKKDGKKKPLGMWEEKVYEKGLFFARPGIYFRLNPGKDDVKEGVRARGIGRTQVLEHWQMIVDTFRAKKASVALPPLSRFLGAKTSIHRVLDKRTDEWRYIRSDDYGQWIKRPIEMSFGAAPKRGGRLTYRNRETGELEYLLYLRSVDLNEPESYPYDKAVVSPEAAVQKLQMQELEEQPDTDLTDYDFDEENQ